MSISTSAQGNQLEVIIGSGSPQYVNFDELDIDVRGTNVIINSSKDKLADAVYTDFSIGGADAQEVARNIAALAGAGSPVTITGTSDTNLDQVDGNAVDTGSGNAGAGTQRVSISSDDVNLSGISSNTSFTSGSVASIDLKTPSLGQSNKSGSVPVTLSSDEDSVEIKHESREVIDNGVVKNVQTAFINENTSGDKNIATLGLYRVLSYFLVADGAVDIKWKDSVNGDLTGPMSMIDGTPHVAPYNEKGWFNNSESTANLQLNLSANVQVSGFVTYITYD